MSPRDSQNEPRVDGWRGCRGMTAELYGDSLTGAERWRKEGGRAERTELWEAEVLSRDFMAIHPK